MSPPPPPPPPQPARNDRPRRPPRGPAGGIAKPGSGRAVGGFVLGAGRGGAGGKGWTPRRGAELDAPIWNPGPGARYVHGEDKLGRFLVHANGTKFSARMIKKLLEDGCCRVNGRIETFASRVLQRGDIVEFTPPEEDAEHQFDAKRILHGEDDLIAYDKPAHLPVTPTDAVKSWSLLDILRQHLPGLIPVHRLDADTSGVVLFSRQEKLARKLEELFAEHTVKKTYLAIVRGHPREAGERRSYLIKTEARQGTERWKSGRGPDAREAVTRWEVQERLGRFGSLVRVEPQTGRHHQIRLHFSEMGHPIYGDLVYGDRQDPVTAGRHLLHAWKVAFTHPLTGRPVAITAPVPREFRTAAERIRKL